LKAVEAIYQNCQQVQSKMITTNSWPEFSFLRVVDVRRWLYWKM